MLNKTFSFRLSTNLGGQEEWLLSELVLELSISAAYKLLVTQVLSPEIFILM